MMYRLDAPRNEPMGAVTLGGNGRYLLAINMDRTQMHVWDLWQMRHRLAEMKLDREIEPAPEPVEPRDPITVVN